MEKRLAFGGLTSALTSIGCLAIFGIMISLGTIAIPFPEKFKFWVNVIIWGLVALFIWQIPMSIAMDVSDKIPAVKKLLAEKPEYKCYPIRHQYAAAIIIINIVFGWTFIGYLVALLWALAPGNVIIPDEIVEELNKAEGEPRNGIGTEREARQ